MKRHFFFLFLNDDLTFRGNLTSNHPYIYTVEYIKKNETVPFAETWMDLQTVIQSEVSQKEKNKYDILMHIYGIQKNGTEEPICKVKIENKLMDAEGRKRWVGMNWEIGIFIHTYYCV